MCGIPGSSTERLTGRGHEVTWGLRYARQGPALPPARAVAGVAVRVGPAVGHRLGAQCGERRILEPHPVNDRQAHPSFLAPIDDVRSYGQGGFTGPLGHRGDAPAPFDALDGPRLAAPGRGHPLPLVDPAELICPTTAGLDGVIEVESPTRVGEAVSGRVRVVARRPIDGRRAGIRLVGVRLSEEERSHEQRDNKGQVISREEWVEVRGRVIDALEFTEPFVPPTLGVGQALDLPFQYPGAQARAPVGACWDRARGLGGRGPVGHRDGP